MRRTQIYLTEEEWAFYRKEAFDREITMSEVIRETLDKNMEKKCKK